MDQPIHQILETALAHHKAGRLGEAELLYRQVLSQQPDHPDALHLLGVLAQKENRPREAEALIRRAIALKGNQAVFYCNLGLVLVAECRWDDAIAACERAVALNPQYYEGLTNLGNALNGARRITEAVQAFRRAAAIRPNTADAMFNLGSALCKSGPLEEAITICRRAVELSPQRVDAYCLLGVALTKSGRLKESEAVYRQALGYQPNHAVANHQLAGVLWLLGQLDEAEEKCRRALELEPESSDTAVTLANILKDQGRIDDAVAAYRLSVKLKPQSYPGYGSLLYSLHFHPGYDTRAVYHEHCLWEAMQARQYENQILPHENDHSPTRRLKIGYLSPHFRNQATSFFTSTLLAAHDHSAFGIYCYADVVRRDDTTAMLKGYADVWRDIAGLSDEQVLRMIRDDRIDILVDLTMHMADARPMLFARKPAPVQVAWLAYPGTTGLRTMDYRFTDPYLDPPGMNDAFYSEICYRLPETVLCYHPLATEPAVNELPALGAGCITFGSLNHFSKANDTVLKMWAAVLAAVPNSRMLVLAPFGSHRDRLLRFAAAAGVDPARIEFLQRQPRHEYLAYYQRIDVILDTFPYNGETTSLDGLWMGVPMITLCGSTAPSRAGLCYLSLLGLEEFVARSPQEYAQLAVRVTADVSRLAGLRATLRARMEQSPLMDGPRFARHVEAAYRTMWQNWISGKKT